MPRLRSDVIDKLRAKYPQYADMNDDALSASVLKAHPEYSDLVNEQMQPTKFDAPVSPYPKTVAALTAAGDLGKGALKGLTNTVTGAEKLVAAVPGGKYFLPPNVDIPAQEKLAQTHNTAQAVGKGVEQAGEFLVPGVGEEALAGRFGGGLAARIGSKALGGAVVNKAQGGTATGGALMGGIGEGLAQGVKAVAPTLAKVSMGVRGGDYARGADPGAAIIARTKGFNPGTVAREAADLNSADLAQLHADADASTIPVPMRPAQDVANGALDEATTRNAGATIKEMQQLSDQLHFQKPGGATSVPFTGVANPVRVSASATGTTRIPDSVPAARALSLKRGVGDLVTSWNPATASDFGKGATERVYGALDKGIDAAVPSSARLNSQMQSMIPVADRAAAKDLNAGVLERVLGRFTRPTGALVGGIAGYEEGKQNGGGLPGALVGGATGLVAPELLTNPTTMMLAARGVNSPLVSRYVVPGMRGLIAQPTRKKDSE